MKYIRLLLAITMFASVLTLGSARAAAPPHDYNLNWPQIQSGEITGTPLANAAVDRMLQSYSGVECPLDHPAEFRVFDLTLASGALPDGPEPDMLILAPGVIVTAVSRQEVGGKVFGSVTPSPSSDSGSSCPGTGVSNPHPAWTDASSGRRPVGRYETSRAYIDLWWQRFILSDGYDDDIHRDWFLYHQDGIAKSKGRYRLYQAWTQATRVYDDTELSDFSPQLTVRGNCQDLFDLELGYQSSAGPHWKLSRSYERCDKWVPSSNVNTGMTNIKWEGSPTFDPRKVAFWQLVSTPQREPTGEIYWPAWTPSAGFYTSI